MIPPERRSELAKVGRRTALLILMKKAVFIERDGVLNAVTESDGQPVPPCRVENFRVQEGAREALQQLKDAGFLVFVTTVQSGVGRGEVSRSEVDRMHRRLSVLLPFDEIFLCASDDETHPCFKPNPGLFQEAMHRWRLEPSQCFVLSDKAPDAQAARILGLTSIMIRSPWLGDDHHDFVLENLAKAVAKIIHLSKELRSLNWV